LWESQQLFSHPKLTINGTSRSSGRRRLFPMKTTTQHLIAEVPRRQSQGKLTIGIDLGDVWSHYCILNEDGEAVDRGRFRTSPKAVEMAFYDALATNGESLGELEDEPLRKIARELTEHLRVSNSVD
jgi:hypothetical protein